MKTVITHRLAAIALGTAALSLSSIAAAEDPADWRPTPEGLRRTADYFAFDRVDNGRAVQALEWGEPIAQGPDGLDLDAFNRENRSQGMIVLHRGRIVYEGYWLGADAESHFVSWSMAKSVTGTLIGIAEGEGLIRSLEDPIVRYVPELAETAYRDVTIEQALQMSSGVRFEEKLGTPTSPDTTTLTCLMMPPGPIFADCEKVSAQFGDVEGLLLSLDQQLAPPGTKFNYTNADALVLGWVLQNATGRSPAEYLSDKVWKRVGMEDDATWLRDPGGMTLTSAALNARLRDYARFGLLMLNDGIYKGERILPEGWVERATTPSKPYLERTDPEVLGYQYQWWVLPSGAFEAEGVQGQFLRIDPEHELVVAMTSVWPTSWHIERAMAFHATVDSIVRALGYEAN